MNLQLLKIIGFKKSEGKLNEDTYAIKFRSYEIDYNIEKRKFHLFWKDCDGYYRGSGFDDCKNKVAKKHFLLCKALNEIERTDFGIEGYGEVIQCILVSMFFAKTTKLDDNLYQSASGNQFDVAERYFKLIRKGAWWERREEE